MVHRRPGSVQVHALFPVAYATRAYATGIFPAPMLVGSYVFHSSQPYRLETYRRRSGSQPGGSWKRVWDDRR